MLGGAVFAVAQSVVRANIDDAELSVVIRVSSSSHLRVEVIFVAVHKSCVFSQNVGVGWVVVALARRKDCDVCLNLVARLGYVNFFAEIGAVGVGFCVVSISHSCNVLALSDIHRRRCNPISWLRSFSVFFWAPVSIERHRLVDNVACESPLRLEGLVGIPAIKRVARSRHIRWLCDIPALRDVARCEVVALAAQVERDNNF